MNSKPSASSSSGKAEAAYRESNVDFLISSGREAPSPSPGCTVACVRLPWVPWSSLITCRYFSRQCLQRGQRTTQRPKDHTKTRARLARSFQGLFFWRGDGKDLCCCCLPLPCPCRAASHPSRPALPPSLVSPALGEWRAEEMC